MGGMEKVRVAAAIFLAGFSAWGAPGNCPDRVANFIDSGIRRVSLTRPENTGSARAILEELRETIDERVREKCPNAQSCPSEELAETVARVTHEVLDDYGQSRSRWPTYALFAATLTTYVAINTAVQHFTKPLTAIIISNFLTFMGVAIFDAIGAPVLEPVTAWIRRIAYAHGADEPTACYRGSAQKRQERIYQTTQELVSATEEEARFTDRQVKTQIASTLAGWCPGPQEDAETFAKRTGDILAVLLADLVPNYVDLDLSELQFAQLPRALVVKRFIDPRLYPLLRDHALQLLSAEYDPEAKEGSQRLQEYQSVLEAWVGREWQ